MLFVVLPWPFPCVSITTVISPQSMPQAINKLTSVATLLIRPFPKACHSAIRNLTDIHQLTWQYNSTNRWLVTYELTGNDCAILQA
jgi:hypothetical protein